MRIYVASSWRNHLQQGCVHALRVMGFDVYDFKHPRAGDNGFSWSSIDPEWMSWTPEQHRKALDHPIARAGFKSDMDALRECDACLLVLPCGRSAHLELGWACGEGKRTCILEAEPIEPDLMYAMCDRLCVTFDEMLDWAESLRR